jgi:putative ABC transport system ATP-binding protein
MNAVLQLPQPRGAVIRLRGVHKSYVLDEVRVPALAGVDLDIEGGCFTVLRGPSGSGKTTLLNVIGCIDRADRGTVQLAEHDTGAMSDDALADLRARRIGFVFQNFNLIGVLTAQENVEYPLLVLGVGARERRERARASLAAVGLESLGDRRPGQLSGGQRQRVAIARALVKQPDLILADEPTASLDSVTGAAIVALLRDLQRRTQVAVVATSHDPAVIERADRVITVRDGKLT